jgi:dTDP-4-dehydrorhamnose 3,5-epimerase-like enzyme
MYKEINFNKIGNQGYGFLSFFESFKEFPYEIKRIYYIYDVPKESNRGFHAHKSLKQLIFCIYGDIELVIDDGKKKEKFRLNSPNYAILLDGVYWRELKWNIKESVLFVVASEYYDENDYIRDYNNFKKYIEENEN